MGRRLGGRKGEVGSWEGVREEGKGRKGVGSGRGKGKNSSRKKNSWVEREDD